MIEDETQDGDGRRKKTRQAITDALIRLMSDRRYAAIRTTDLIQAAGVGRSTFYEHFPSKTAVLEAVVEPILAPLALAGAGRGNTARLRIMLDHLWERRALESRVAEGVPASLAARGAAARQLVMLHTWLVGEVSCGSDALAKALVGVR